MIKPGDFVVHVDRSAASWRGVVLSVEGGLAICETNAGDREVVSASLLALPGKRAKTPRYLPGRPPRDSIADATRLRAPSEWAS